MPELTPEKLKAMIDMATRFNSDLTQVQGGDKDGKPEFLCVYATGEYVMPIIRFLQKLAERMDSKAADAIVDAREQARQRRQDNVRQARSLRGRIE